jgi:short-subunit dehydrogenase
MDRAIVLGAGGGIGRATVLELANRGFEVAAISRREASLADLAEHAGGSVRTWACDVTDFGQLAATLDEVVGNEPFRLAVHCAATYEPVGRYVEAEPADIQAAIALNVTSAFLVARHLLAHATRMGEGTVALITSGASKRVAKYRAMYSATKAAVDQFVTVVGAELIEAGSPVVLTAINPGKVDTAMQSGLRASADTADPLVRQALAEFRGGPEGLLRPEHVAAQLVSLLLEPGAACSGEVISLQTGAFHNPV